MGNIEEKNPIDMEAKILDMKEKIKYMDTKMYEEKKKNQEDMLE